MARDPVDVIHTHLGFKVHPQHPMADRGYRYRTSQVGDDTHYEEYSPGSNTHTYLGRGLKGVEAQRAAARDQHAQALANKRRELGKSDWSSYAHTLSTKAAASPSYDTHFKAANAHSKAANEFSPKAVAGDVDAESMVRAHRDKARAHRDAADKFAEQYRATLGYGTSEQAPGLTIRKADPASPAKPPGGTPSAKPKAPPPPKKTAPTPVPAAPKAPKVPKAPALRTTKIVSMSVGGAMGKGESDFVKEYSLPLSMGGLKHWHSACLAGDDSAHGKAAKAEGMKSKSYSRSAAAALNGNCYGCRGELSLDPPEKRPAGKPGEDLTDGHDQNRVEKMEKAQQFIESRYRITTPSGEVHEGKVHGNGGVLRGNDGIKRMLMLQCGESDQANIYEPKPGHVAMYHPNEAEIENPKDRVKHVPLQGATIELLGKTEQYLDGARFHYAKLLDAQRLNKGEAAGKAADLCNRYLRAAGFDPAAGVPDAAKSPGSVDLSKSSFRLDRAMTMLPLVKAGTDNSTHKRTKEFADKFSSLASHNPSYHAAAAMYNERYSKLPGAYDSAYYARRAEEHRKQMAAGSTVQKTNSVPGSMEPSATLGGDALAMGEKGMPRHSDGKVDSRYSIQRSYTGHASGKPQHVVYFNGMGQAGERVGSHETREGAEQLAREHASKRAAGTAGRGQPASQWAMKSEEWDQDLANKIQRRADEHQKAGRTNDAKALRDKIGNMKGRAGQFDPRESTQKAEPNPAGHPQPLEKMRAHLRKCGQMTTMEKGGGNTAMDTSPVHGSKELGAALHQWHESSSDPIYGAGSFFFAGKPAPRHQVEGALQNIKQLINQPRGLGELRQLSKIKRGLEASLGSAQAATPGPMDRSPSKPVPR